MFYRFLTSLFVATIISSNCVLAGNSQPLLRVHFINVGRGDATLLEYPCGTILFDAGGDKGKAEKLTNYLDAYFDSRPDLARRLDLFVLSHGHPDHTRFSDEVFKRYEIGTLLTNGHLKFNSYKQIGKLLKRHPEIDHQIVDTEDIPPGGLSVPTAQSFGCTGGPDSEVLLLWGDSNPKPVGRWGAKGDHENNHSVALMAVWGNTRTLFTGDMYRAALLAMLDQHASLLKDIDLYQVSHHGLPSGTVPKFDTHIRPRVAVLSRNARRSLRVKTLNRFNNVVREKRDPARVPAWIDERSNATMDELDANMLGKVDIHTPGRIYGSATLTSAIYWTGRDGTIVVELKPDGGLSLETVPGNR